MADLYFKAKLVTFNKNAIGFFSWIIQVYITASYVLKQNL